MGDVQVIQAKLENWSKEYQGPKFHAVLCDPPYGLSFMGKKWDEMVEAKAWGEAIMPHLYPGALVLMFGGTRTWHRLACGMEDAGFEMWDTMMWLYGQGFPKAQKIPGWAGYKTTALKPAWEPILAFKKPLEGTYAEMAMQYGSGALNVDGGRIGGPVPPTGSGASHKYGWAECEKETVWAGSSGRYPANLILDETSAALLDEQTGSLGKSTGGRANQTTSDKYGDYANNFEQRDPGFGDSGGASRFFYCAKASTAERNKGLEGRNTHPTVKPIALAKYLATLILPPDSVKPRRLLVPFAGSGSEMIGASQAGWDEIVGIEQEAPYCEFAQARTAYWENLLLGT